MGERSGRIIGFLSLAAVLLGMLAIVASASAAEDPPPLFTTVPEDQVPGAAAGRVSEPNAIAVDPVTHHVFVAERQQGSIGNNNRISEFTAWGEFVKAFGWGVRDGADELQVCTGGTGCQKGIEGSKPGQFNRPNGLAFDAAGNLYVFERINGRVQKFDPTTGPEGKEVQILLSWGSAGNGDGQFLVENLQGVNGNYIAIDPTDKVTAGGTVYVADKGRIQAFDTAGNFKFKFALPQDLNPGALAYDPVSGDLYFAFNQENPGGPVRPTVYRLKTPTGEVVDEITPELKGTKGEELADSTIALAVDPLGNLYVIDDPLGNFDDEQPRVMKFDSSGTLLVEFDEIEPDELDDQPLEEPALAVATVGLDPSEMQFYVAHRRFEPGVASVKIYGAVPDPTVGGPPPLVPPTIMDQYAISVNDDEATVRAAINPNFWSDTTYYVEYGTVDCAIGSCASSPTPPGLQLTTKVIKATLTTQGILLDGLQSSTKYFYRFVAQSSGGGPVAGPSVTFITRAAPGAQEPCPENEAFRTGPAANLSDCRAYEMVSPVDKNSADISLVFNSIGFPAGFDQADPAGDELSYAAYRAFAGSAAAPYTVQYLAARQAGGWSNRSLAPRRDGPSFLGAPSIDAEYRAFTPGLDEAFLFRQTNPLLDSAAPAGYPNLYRRENGTDTYEALITSTPPNPPDDFRPLVQGYGGGCTVFQANDQLTIDAATSTKNQLYKHCKGLPLELVSLLPGGGGPAAEASAGTGGGDDRRGRLAGAVSEDGQVVFWSDQEEGQGDLYARIGNTETVALSKGPAQFWGAAADGSVAIFSESGDLYEFEVGIDAPEAASKIAGEVDGVMGASSDASVIYFLSAEVLAGGASAGDPNLYRYDSAAGTFTFIATLAEEDAISVGQPRPGPVKAAPAYHSSRVTPDGGAVAFTSVASLTGFDNTDAQTGKADTEVFVYRFGSGQLLCVSCDPSGVRPAGRGVSATGNGQDQPTAGELQAPYNSLYAPRVISDDGSRVFFNSYVPLVGGDANGKADVYQWEAEGKGTCKEGAPGHDASLAGCVNLISSGESPQDSTFVDSSADGRDVFFKTGSSLVSQDPGLVDIYDAREGGGLPPPLPPPLICQENCQSPGPAPSAPVPSSQGFYGPGNVKHCPKGTRKATKGGKQVCVRKKKPRNKSKGKKKQGGASKRSAVAR